MALVALLQQTGRAEDAEEPLRALEAAFKLLSRLHATGHDWVAARLALARGDRQAAFARLAQAGSVGNRSGMNVEAARREYVAGLSR